MAERPMGSPFPAVPDPPPASGTGITPLEQRQVSQRTEKIPGINSGKAGAANLPYRVCYPTSDAASSSSGNWRV
ncbi:hypothetical protein WISP_94038 [Willisornis vidua]|uniref:Uncharacterized protein n=1 Tax=Willisornis vidua TaxID=1566151 RepID=A0ABQ9D6K2_9PASS|nr:hypothetical protein WISP_94038 [Willisornis vidua]